MKFCVLNIYNLYLDGLNFAILVQIIEIFFVKQHKTGKKSHSIKSGLPSFHH